MATVEFTELDSPTVVELQEGWANAPSYRDLHYDYVDAEDSQEAYKTKLLNYQDILNGGRKRKQKTGKSNARPLLARKQAEWTYSALEMPFLNTVNMFEITPRTYEDAEAAEQNSLVLNYQWSTKIPKTKIVGDIVRNLVDEGTAIVKTGWDAEIGYKIVESEEPVYATPEESIQLMQQKVQAGEMSQEEAQAMMEMGQPVEKGKQKVYNEEETLIRNQPTYEVCNNAHVIIDPTCEGIIADAKFVIHEFEH